jgi:hypothetical protein
MTDHEKNSRVVNPHDKLFRETYSNKENARSFLSNYLPEQVLKLVDLSTLEISKVTMTGMYISSCWNIWSKYGGCISNNTRKNRSSCPL